MKTNTFNTFFAWQSENTRECRNLIEECLKKALKNLALPQAVAKLDRDTQGCPGTPDVVETILKKIQSAGAFIADVSLVGTDQRNKRIPNPNVMFELGFAVENKGWNKILLVINEDFAPWEEAPFDLGGSRRWPIKYSLPKDGDKSSAKEKLVKSLTIALREIYKEHVSDNLLNCGNAALDISGFYLAMSRSGNEEITVSGFQANLVNNGDRPIKEISGFIQIDRDDSRFDLGLNKNGHIVDSGKLKMLPLFDKIGIAAPFVGIGRSDKIIEQDFLKNYAPFTLFLKIDGIESSHSFSYKDIKRQFLRFHEDTDEENFRAGPVWNS